MAVATAGKRSAGGNIALQNFDFDFAYIEDPDERRRLALAEIDRAPFGWYHIRAVIVAGTGFFTDAYDLFAINLVNPMLGVVYWAQADASPGTIPASADTAIKAATSAGTVVGQLGFGILADAIGRKKMYGIELIIIILSTLAQTLSSSSPSVTIVGVMVFWRVIMGIGIGGDYPLSAIITSEFATTKWRGAMMGSVFAMQGFGQLCASIVALILAAGFKSSLSTASSVAECTGTCGLAVDQMWRVLVGFGAVPGCFALYFRLTIPETPRYTFDVERDVEKGGQDVKNYIHRSKGEANPNSTAKIEALRKSANYLQTQRPAVRDFFAYFGKWEHGKVLMGTALSWFFLDCAFYGLGLNSSIILSSIGYSGKGNAFDTFWENAVGQTILVCAGALPGYWATVALVDTVGRKPIQLGGFIILTVIFCVIGFAFHILSTTVLFALYVLAQFFFNLGPNSTTFIVPGECFPTRYRSSGHGISAAAGKVGAIVAQVSIGTLRTRGATADDPNPWLDHVMQIYALFMLCGCFTTLLIPETKRKTLEELTGEEMSAELALETLHGRSMGDWGTGTNRLRYNGVLAGDPKDSSEATGSSTGRKFWHRKNGHSRDTVTTATTQNDPYDPRNTILPGNAPPRPVYRHRPVYE